MRVFSAAFDKIAEGKKVLELRLYDDKRRKLELHDTITFTRVPGKEENMSVKIVGLLHYPSFKDLLTDCSLTLLGYPEDYPVSNLVEKMHDIYSQEQEQALGVLGIKVKLL